MGFINDLVNGKEKKIKADPLSQDINAAGKSGLAMINSAGNQLNESFYNNPNSYVNNQIDLENKMMRTASDDASRRTRSLIQSRGMGESSIGLGQQVNQDRQLNDRIAMNNASGMDRLKGVLNEKMNTGSNMFNIRASQGPVQMTDQTYRTGGYGQLIGAGLTGGFSALGSYLGNKSAQG